MKSEKAALFFVALLVALVWMVVPAKADTLQCVNGDTLAQIMAMGSCQIGDKIFSDFTYTDSAQGGATAITADGISVYSMGPSGSGAGISSVDIGLEFIAPWSVSNGQAEDSNIQFDVDRGRRRSVDDHGCRFGPDVRRYLEQFGERRRNRVRASALHSQQSVASSYVQQWRAYKSGGR